MSDSPTHDGSLKELAARLARGDEAAFAELYDACVGQLHRYLALRLRSLDSASDVIQSTFLRAVKGRRRFRGVANPVAYVFQIARNEASRYTSRGEILSGTGDAVVGQTGSTDGITNTDDAEVVSAALARLGDDERELVQLKLFSDLTFREIAVILNRPQATVATQYRRALESLRPWLAKQYR